MLGKSEKRSLEGYLERLIEHILKRRATAQIAAANAFSVQVCGTNSTAIAVRDLDANASAYWQVERDLNYKHWKVEIINFRSRIARLLKRNPSFNRYMAEVYPEIFRDVVKSWQVEFEIPNNSFIKLEQILSENYFDRTEPQDPC